jgi:hypothetical protein
MPFPSLTFLGAEALRDSNRHRIRHWLIFLLRCTLIFVVVLAFGRPYERIEYVSHGRAVVMVVDNSHLWA